MPRPSRAVVFCLKNTLEIACAPFAMPDTQDLGAAPTGLFGLGKKGNYIGIGAAAAAFLAALVVTLSRRGKKTTRGAVGRLPAGKASDVALPPGQLAPALPAVPRAEPEVVRSRALEIAAKDPATAAVILRTWLNAPSSVNTGARSGS